MSYLKRKSLQERLKNEIDLVDETSLSWFEDLDLTLLSESDEPRGDDFPDDSEGNAA